MPCLPTSPGHQHAWHRICRVLIIHNEHYNDVIMSAIASQITGVSIVCSTVGSDTDQRKHQSSAALAFVRWLYRWQVNSPHKRPVTRIMFPFDDVIMRNANTCPTPVLRYDEKSKYGFVCFLIKSEQHGLAIQECINRCGSIDSSQLQSTSAIWRDWRGWGQQGDVMKGGDAKYWTLSIMCRSLAVVFIGI